jgi:diadenosine tetraphosphate (Ap4A) HIT family hydrolase
MKSWPDDWAERMRGKDCPMCAEGRPDEVHGNMRLVASRLSDAYLVRRDVGQRGYAMVIWRGRHVADATELGAEEAASYFNEVLRVGRAIEKHYRPIKMNFEILGNSLPHLHTHVVPRYLDDGEPGHPAGFMRGDAGNAPSLSEREYLSDVEALRAILR